MCMTLSVGKSTKFNNLAKKVSNNSYIILTYISLIKNSMKKLQLLLLSIAIVGCNNKIEKNKERNQATNIVERTVVEKLGNRTKVAFLIYPEIAILDMTGPMDAFIKINRMTENQYDVYTVSETTDFIQTQGHIIEINADYTFENAPKPDIFIIPGAKVDVAKSLANDSSYANYIKETVSTVKKTMSVCTASFILRKLGLLDGKKATTHWILN